MNDDMSERKMAEENLEEAIKDFLATCGHDEGLLVDWMLVTAHHIDSGDGDTWTANGIYGPREQPIYRAAGLVTYAQIKVSQKLNRGGIPS